LESKFPGSIFQSNKLVEYQSTQNGLEHIPPVLYDAHKQIVVIVSDQYNTELISDLYNSGYTPIIYTQKALEDLFFKDQTSKTTQTRSLVPSQNIFATTEVDDLIEKTPGWLLRSGILITAIVTLGLITFSGLFKYPDKIVCRGVLSSDNPPVILQSKVNGRIEQIFVESNETISEGQNIFYVENTAKPEDVDKLKSLLKNLVGTNEKINNVNMPSFLTLGMMQEEFGRLQVAYKALKQLESKEGISLELANAKSEINLIDELNRKLNSQILAAEAERQIVEKEISRNQQLLEEGLISEQELEGSQIKLTRLNQTLEKVKREIIGNNIKKESLALTGSVLSENNSNSIESSSFAVRELWEKLNNTIREWEDIYYIKSTIDGQIELPSAMKVNTLVNPEIELATIFPIQEQSNKYYMRTAIPSLRKGKIKADAKAIIKFDAYPFKEFGYYITTVDQISASSIFMEDQRYYEAIVKVDTPIITEYNEQIHFEPNMSATVEIITDDRSLLSRIMQSLLIE